jgi:hypothetical protein
MARTVKPGAMYVYKKDRYQPFLTIKNGKHVEKVEHSEELFIKYEDAINRAEQWSKDYVL